MTSSLPSRFRRNALSNYATSVVALVVALVTTPILVRGLGKDAWGVWVLIGSTVLYFDLLRFGFGRGVVKWVAEGTALDDRDLIRRTLATAFFLLVIPGAFVLLLVPGIVALFPVVFDVPPALETAAMITIVLVALDLAIAMPADTFGASLIGLQRYDLLNVTVIATLIAQAVGWALVVALGGGIVALGVVTLTLSVASQIARYLIVKRRIPVMRLRPRYFDRALVRPFVSLSGWIALAEFCYVIIVRIDVIVVGIIVGVPEAGVYAVGQKLAQLVGRFTNPSLGMFFPHAAALGARGDRSGLRSTLSTGTRLAVGIAAPLTIALCFLGAPLIEAWVGAGFSEAVAVVVYLSLAALVGSVSETGVFILRGTGDVKRPALIYVGEAALNFTLSVALGLRMGLEGVALATLIGTFVANAAFLFPYVCRRLEVAPWVILGPLTRTLLPPVAAAVAAGWALRTADVSGIPEVLAAGLLIIAVYVGVLFTVGLQTDERQRVLAVLGLRRAPVLEAATSKAPLIAVYTDDPALAGTSRILATLVGGLSPRFDVAVVGVDKSIVDGIAAERPGTRTVVLPPVRHKWSIRPILAHVRAIRRLRPDILHANLRYPWAAQYGVLAGLLARGTRVIAVENSPIEPSNARQRWIRKRLVRRYAAYVGVGVRVARKTEAILGLPEGSVKTIHNGVPLKTVTSGVQRASSGPVVGAVARLSPEKGFDVLLRSLVGLPGVTAVLVGDGPERSSLEVDARQLGLDGRVVFAGWHDEPETYLGSFDVFVLCSRVEGFPLSVLEAMGAGLPVVATTVGSVDELVLDGQTGLLIEPEDVVALREAIAILVGDPDMRRRMGEAGKRRVENSFSPETMVTKYEALYDEVLP